MSWTLCHTGIGPWEVLGQREHHSQHQKGTPNTLHHNIHSTMSAFCYPSTSWDGRSFLSFVSIYLPTSMPTTTSGGAPSTCMTFSSNTYWVPCTRQLNRMNIIPRRGSRFSAQAKGPSKHHPPPELPRSDPCSPHIPFSIRLGESA